MDESSESSSEEKSKALERTFVQSINNDSNSMIIGGGDSMTGYLYKVVIVCEAKRCYTESFSGGKIQIKILVAGFDPGALS